jgi:SAM-dependent methyltransferase
MTKANDYDGFGDVYAEENETGINNAYYERPAMLALAGDVSGRRILDAGCGAGPLSAALRGRGAVVSGFDKSPRMLDLARHRLGPDADLREHDLADPLPYADAEFDDVVASLSLHYLEDWGPTLGEFRRVLKPGGRFIMSTNHPTAEYCVARLQGRRPDYFATYEETDEWTTATGHTFALANWRRPLHAMTDAFTAAGFRILTISEPQPAPEARELFPEAFHLMSTAPSFIFFVLAA